MKDLVSMNFTVLAFVEVHSFYTSEQNSCGGDVTNSEEGNQIFTGGNLAGSTSDWLRKKRSDRKRRTQKRKVGLY